MKSDEKCGDCQTFEIDVASLGAKFNIIMFFLLSIVGLSGWTTIVATDSRQDIAVLNNTFALTAKTHEISSNMMREQIIALEEKDDDKEKRIEDVEEICFFND